MSSPPSIEALKDQITDAFAGVARPADDEISYSRQTADGVELSEAIKDKDRTALSPEFMMIYALSFYSPAGFQHFVPAYLIAALQPENITIRKELIFLFEPGENKPTALTRFAQLSAKLSESQKSALRAFVDAVKDHFPRDFAFPPPK